MGVRSVKCCQRAGNGQRTQSQKGERVAWNNPSKPTRKLIEEKQQLSAAVIIGGYTYKATIYTGAMASFVSEELEHKL